MKNVDLAEDRRGGKYRERGLFIHRAIYAGYARGRATGDIAADLHTTRNSIKVIANGMKDLPTHPGHWSNSDSIVRAAIAWAQARQAVLQEETPDVRTSTSFRERLEALATAEQRLVAATGRKESP